MGGYIAGEGEFENGGREPRGPQKRAQTNFFQNCFEKNVFLFLRGYVAGEGEFENDGREPRGPR